MHLCCQFVSEYQYEKLKTAQFDGVKFLTLKSGSVNLLTNIMSGLASMSATDCNPSQTLIVAQAPHIIRLKYKKRPHVDVDIDVDVDALLVYDDEDACEVMGCGRWVKPRQPSCIKDSLPLWQRD